MGRLKLLMSVEPLPALQRVLKTAQLVTEPVVDLMVIRGLVKSCDKCWAAVEVLFLFAPIVAMWLRYRL